MQTIVVAVIVACAALFAVWRLMPRAWRVRLASLLAAGARRHVRLSEDGAQALARKLAVGACGSCDSCGSCGPAQPAAPRAAPLVRLAPRGGEADTAR